MFTGCSKAPKDEANENNTSHTTKTQNSNENSVSDKENMDNLVNENIVPWSKYEILSEQQLRFFFTMGNPDCYGSRIESQETNSTILVATIVGNKPETQNNICTLNALEASMTIKTKTPITNRNIQHLQDIKLHK